MVGTLLKILKAWVALASKDLIMYKLLVKEWRASIIYLLIQFSVGIKWDLQSITFYFDRCWDVFFLSYTLTPDYRPVRGPQNGVGIFFMCLFHNSCLFKLKTPAWVAPSYVSELEFNRVWTAHARVANSKSQCACVCLNVSECRSIICERWASIWR